MTRRKGYDAFISHASEDKAAIAEPLARELRKRGLEIWFDKFELKVGDSLRESIERGLAKSRFGIVIFSSSFFKKRWPRKELNGLFSREISGRKKRILPVLHELDIKEITKRFPIQADKFCLSSALPLDDLCEQLIAVIKPQLITIEGLRERAQEVSQSLISAAQKEFPGYTFGISSNTISSDGTLAPQKIEIRMSDPQLAKPLQLNVTFVGDGVRKADEFMRTGKPQSWKSGEFLSVNGNWPLFREMTNGEISVRGPADKRPRPVCVQCGNGSIRYMTMTLARRGTEEAAFDFSSENEALSFSLVLPFSKRKKYGVSFKWDIAGHSASRLKTLVEFLDGLAAGSDIVITDLRGDFPELRLPLATSKKITSPFNEADKKLLFLCAQIEENFRTKIPMRMTRTDDDVQTLTILDSLLNGTTVSVAISGTVSIRKGDNAAADAALCEPNQNAFSMFSPVENYDGFMPLFGIQIPVPLWGIFAKCEPDLPQRELELFCASPDGAVLKLRLRNEGIGQYHWASAHPNRTIAAKKRRLP